MPNRIKYNKRKIYMKGYTGGNQELKPEIFNLQPRAGHLIKPNCNHLPSDVLKIFTNSEQIPISHIVSDSTSSVGFNRILTDDSPALMYQRTRGEFKRVLHWGQLKLMLTEIEFLTLALHQYNIKYKGKKADQRPPFVMVYAGAAPGHHTQYLSQLFPQIHFELYDPNEFVISNSKKIKIHVQFFTDKEAKYWANRTTQNTSDKPVHLVFCTDIRTEPATDENVRLNMEMQMQWWSIMNPNLTMFKFRLPWNAGKTRYPKGQIYIQPFPGPTSTETRLIVEQDAEIIEYDNEKYEAQLFYHNNVIRKQSFKLAGELLNLTNDPTILYNHVDSCYDCTSFIFIVSQYIKLQHPHYNDKKQIDATKTLIMDIQLNITFSNHTIHTQTVRHINDALEKLRRSCYVPCDNAKCAICKHSTDTLARQWKGASKATVESTLKAIGQI